MTDIVCLTDDCPNNENGCCNGDSLCMDYPCNCDTEICQNYHLKNISRGEVETLETQEDSILVYDQFSYNQKDKTIFRKIKQKIITMKILSMRKNK
jgi:hypothetical protein